MNKSTACRRCLLLTPTFASSVLLVCCITFAIVAHPSVYRFYGFLRINTTRSIGLCMSGTLHLARCYEKLHQQIRDDFKSNADDAHLRPIRSAELDCASMCPFDSRPGKWSQISNIRVTACNPRFDKEGLQPPTCLHISVSDYYSRCQAASGHAMSRRNALPQVKRSL